MIFTALTGDSYGYGGKRHVLDSSVRILGGLMGIMGRGDRRWDWACGMECGRIFGFGLGLVLGLGIGYGHGGG